MEEKLKVEVYKGLTIILGKVKSVALAQVMGCSNSWISNKHKRYVVKNRTLGFAEADIPILNEGLVKLSDEILKRLVKYSEDRDVTIGRVKELGEWVSMPYIYGDVLKKTKGWYSMRMVRRTTEGKVSTYREDDILAINMAAMQIANELKSIELILKQEL